MKIELLSCPDCGSSAEVNEAFFWGTTQSYSYVHCTNPLCHMSSHNPHFTGHSPEENDENAAISWNERFAETLHADAADSLSA